MRDPDGGGGEGGGVSIYPEVSLLSFLVLSWVGETGHFISRLWNVDKSGPGTAVLSHAIH